MVYSKPRHVWRAIYPILVFFGVQLVAGMVLTFILAYLVTFVFASGGELGAALSQFDLDALLSGDTSVIINELAGSGFVEVYFDSIMWIQLGLSSIAIATLYPMWRFARSKPVAYSGGKLNLKIVLLLIGAGIGANYIISFLITLFNLVSYFPEYAEIENMLSGGSLIPQILAVGLIGPVAEEICFRGIVQKRLNEWMPAWMAVVVSAVAFGLMHMNILQGAYATIFGVALSLIYLKFRTLWAPVIGHISINLSSVLLGALFENISAEMEIAMWAEILIFAALIIVGVFCAYKLFKTPTAEPTEEEIKSAARGSFNSIAEIDGFNRDAVNRFILRYLGSAEVLVRGKVIDLKKTDGYIVLNGREKTRDGYLMYDFPIIGMVTYVISDGVCEIITLNCTSEGRDTGAWLVEKVKETAAVNGCRKLRLITTNDNLTAIGFYQRQGFDITEINFGAVDREREFKPGIPLIAANGIPIKHEIELEMKL